MKIPLPYYPQHTNFSCGPVCLKMLFAHHGVDYSEEKLIQLCHSVPKFGTSHEHLIEEVRREHFYPHQKTSATIEDILQYLDTGTPVLVNYLNPTTNNGHYSIVCGYEEESLILADPTNGADYHISHQEFFSHWHNKNNTSSGWLLVVTKN